jgi:F-type H+-transporting ATPase subunit a
MAAGHGDTFHHVRDFPYFELPFGVKIDLPEIAGLPLTKFMVLQLVAFAAAFLIFRGLARRIGTGEPARGRWWNFWEMLALYIRDEVVRPTIGGGHEDHEHAHEAEETTVESNTAFGHPADKYLPFVWSCFFYVLFCNLIGAFPWMGAATGNINVTGALALVAMSATIFYGSSEKGLVGFWTGLSPSMDLPGIMKPPMVLMIWAIELFGMLVKHAVLAIRLFANMMAGHTVVAVILGFIALAAHSGMFYLVAPASIVGQLAISALELFVAFLQAYIFAFLATLFIGMGVHEH